MALSSGQSPPLDISYLRLKVPKTGPGLPQLALWKGHVVFSVRRGWRRLRWRRRRWRWRRRTRQAATRLGGRSSLRGG